MARMANQNTFPALVPVTAHFHMYLGHQRADGIEDPQLAPRRLLPHRLGDAVGAEDHRRPVRHLVQLLDEDRPLLAQGVDDIFIVHHFMADINRRAEKFQGPFNYLYGPVDAGTETAGIS